MVVRELIRSQVEAGDRSLAIGIGIGVAILTAIVILYVLPFGRGVVLDFEDAALSSEDNAQFWMFGLIREINPKVQSRHEHITT